MQTALDNDDSARAKELFKQFSCRFKQRIPDEKDERSRQIMIKTVNLLDKRVEETKPDKDCSCKDLRLLLKGIVLGVKLVAGYTLGSLTAPVDAAIQSVCEGVETGLTRLHDGNLSGTVTGILAGAEHGLSQGASDAFFKGYGLPLQN